MSNHTQGVSQDSGQAEYWYRQAAAQGHAIAQENLTVFLARKGGRSSHSHSQSTPYYDGAVPSHIEGWSTEINWEEAARSEEDVITETMMQGALHDLEGMITPFGL